MNVINPEHYARAAALLDELTDGHKLDSDEAQVLLQLEDAILSYEKNCERHETSIQVIDGKTTANQLLEDLIYTLQLRPVDLPEIGNATVVSQVLEGKRPISRQMAFALGERFHIAPSAFFQKPPLL